MDGLRQRALCVAHNARYGIIAVALEDSLIKIYNSDLICDDLLATSGAVHAIAFSPTGFEMLTAASSEIHGYSITVWDIQPIPRHNSSYVITQRFSFIGVDPSNRFSLHTDTITCLESLPHPYTRSSYKVDKASEFVDIASSLTIVVSGGKDWNIKLWDYSQRESSAIQSTSLDNTEIRSLSFSDDGVLLLVTTAQNVGIFKMIHSIVHETTVHSMFMLCMLPLNDPLYSQFLPTLQRDLIPIYRFVTGFSDTLKLYSTEIDEPMNQWFCESFQWQSKTLQVELNELSCHPSSIDRLEVAHFLVNAQDLPLSLYNYLFPDPQGEDLDKENISLLSHADAVGRVHLWAITQSDRICQVCAHSMHLQPVSDLCVYRSHDTRHIYLASSSSDESVVIYNSYSNHVCDRLERPPNQFTMAKISDLEEEYEQLLSQVKLLGQSIEIPSEEYLSEATQAELVNAVKSAVKFSRPECKNELFNYQNNSQFDELAARCSRS